MTVQVYKPIRRTSKPVQSSLRRRALRSTSATQTVRDISSLRKVRHTYRQIQPSLDLDLAIEALTHPDSPTFDELEAVINFEELGVAE